MSLKRGDRVLYEGKVYYFVPLGTACRLYTNPELEGPASHTPARTSVTKYEPPKTRPKKKKSKKALAAEKAIDSLPEVTLDEPATSPIKTIGHRYLYVMVDLARTQRHVKIGITNDVNQRMRSYRTRVPDDFPVLVVDVEGRLNAKELETSLRQHFSDKCLHGSEVIEVTVRQIEKWLLDNGYGRFENGLFLSLA